MNKALALNRLRQVIAINGQSATELSQLPVLSGVVSILASAHVCAYSHANFVRSLLGAWVGLVRRPVDLDNYEPPLQLLKILPVASTIKRDRGIGQQVGPKNSSYLQVDASIFRKLVASQGMPGCEVFVSLISEQILGRGCKPC